MQFPLLAILSWEYKRNLAFWLISIWLIVFRCFVWFAFTLLSNYIIFHNISILETHSRVGAGINLLLSFSHCKWIQIENILISVFKVICKHYKKHIKLSNCVYFLEFFSFFHSPSLPSHILWCYNDQIRINWHFINAG